MSLLNEVIDLDLAANRGACYAGLVWAQDHPGATIRDLAAHSPRWAAWYMTEAMEWGIGNAAMALMELRPADLSDADTVRALGEAWSGRVVVKLLASLWGDDARMVDALAAAGWSPYLVAKAMRDGFPDDETRLVLAVSRVTPSDAELVHVLYAIWFPQHMIRALSRLWGEEARVHRAMVQDGFSADSAAGYIRSAWIGLERYRPHGLVRLADADPVPAQA